MDQSISQAADRVATELDADVISYRGEIGRHADRNLISECIQRRRRNNVVLMLVTLGGDPDAAYRIARCLQDKYENFTLYVSGVCKSAGTLIALGAHELVISDHGELGPLDVQMPKKDDLWDTQSGLTVMDTLSALQDNAFDAFEKFFLNLEQRSAGTISLRTAAEIGTQMTNGMFSQLYRQIDPLHIGEAAREMSIAGHYGRRLLVHSRNIDLTALNAIMSEYPSHSFVIDRKEAELLFDRVREPSDDEVALAEAVGSNARWPTPGLSASFSFLSTEVPKDDESVGEETTEGNDDAT